MNSNMVGVRISKWTSEGYCIEHKINDERAQVKSLNEMLWGGNIFREAKL